MRRWPRPPRRDALHRLRCYARLVILYRDRELAVRAQHMAAGLLVGAQRQLERAEDELALLAEQAVAGAPQPQAPALVERVSDLRVAPRPGAQCVAAHVEPHRRAGNGPAAPLEGVHKNGSRLRGRLLDQRDERR